MSFSQIATSVSIISSGLKGYQAISLTQFVTSAQSLIASGSAIEIANAFFLADGNVTPNASSWTAVGTGNVAYISLLPAGSAGVQTLSAWYSDTAPTWVTSKAGWYASAASLTRYVASVLKTGTDSYEWANILTNVHGDLQTRRIGIGDWNMDDPGLTSVTIAHGLAAQDQLRSVNVIIFQDDGAKSFALDRPNTNTDFDTQGGVLEIAAAGVKLARRGHGAFDSADFNATGFNRGFITIEYAL